MTAVHGHSTDDFLSNLLGQLIKLIDGQRLEILRTVNGSQQ
jgi:hypothetical protein